MIEIKNAREISQPWIRVFLYGDTGASKSHSAYTFPYPFVIVPSTENSIITGRGQDIPYTEAAGPTELNAVLTYLEDSCRKAQQFLHEGKTVAAWDAFPYQTVVLESLSHYTDLIIEELTVGGQKKMDMQQWGLLSSHLRNIHTRLSNLPVHVVYTALAQVKDGENGGTNIGGALMSGAMATKLPSACDVIGYCEQTMTKEGMQYRIHFRRFKQFAARIRAPRGVETPAYIDDFHFNKIAPFFGIEVPEE